MEWVWIVLISIVLLAAISIAIVAIIVAVNKEQNVNDTCRTQSDCLIGYVCSNVGTGGTGICKAGVGTSCTNNDNCSNNLICTNGHCAQPPSATFHKSPINIPTPVTPLLPNDIEPLVTTSIDTIPTPKPIETTPREEIEQIVHIDTFPDRSEEEIRQPTPLTIMKSGEQDATLLVQSSSPSLLREMQNYTSTKDEMVRKVIPRSQQRYYRDDTTIDDEENSGGSVLEVPFDVRSAEDSTTPRVSTPYQERNGVYYCRSNILELGHDQHSPVIDVCSYSNATIFLLEDSNIICEIKTSDGVQRRKTSSNIRLIRITTFSGYMYGVGHDNRLYTLPNSYFLSTNWVWSIVNWAPTNITHISSTYNSSHLWIQTADKGILYNAPGTVQLEEIRQITRRVYGRDVEHYMDIDPTKFTAVIQPGGRLINNVYDGALSYYDEIVAIQPSERHLYRRITIVDWNPYYIRA